MWAVAEAQAAPAEPVAVVGLAVPVEPGAVAEPARATVSAIAAAPV